MSLKNKSPIRVDRSSKGKLADRLVHTGCGSDVLRAHWMGLVLLILAWTVGPVWSEPTTVAPNDRPFKATTPTGQSGDGSTTNESEAADRPASPTSSDLDAREVGPEVYYLEDAAGNLVPVPLDLKFEDFARLYREKTTENSADAAPPYTLSNLSITGQVSAEQAVNDRALLEVTVELETYSSQPVRIPLQMDSLILRGPVTHVGSGSFHFGRPPHTSGTNERNGGRHPEPGGGYVLWLGASPAGKHTFRIPAAIKVVDNGTEKRIRLTAPLATQSRLVLNVPELHLDVAVKDEASIVSQRVTNGLLPRPTEVPLSTPPNPPVDSNSAGEEVKTKMTQIEVQGLGGDVDLSWQARKAIAPSYANSIETSGQLTVRIRNSGTVTTEAQFDVRSFGGPLGSLRVQIPANAELAPVAGNAQYKIRAVDGQSGDSKNSRLWLVTFSQSDLQQATIRLVTEQTIAATDEGTTCQPVDFQILESDHHFGTVALFVEPRWLVRWQEGPHVRRIATTVQGQEQTRFADFEYYRQPIDLPLTLRQKTTRVLVAPRYDLDIESDQVTLKGSFDVNVRGAPASFLEFDMAPWQVVGVEAEQLRQDAFVLEEVAPLVVPLTQAVTGQFPVQIIARQPIPVGAERIHVQLPVLRNAVTTPPVVSVSAADNVIWTAIQEDIPQLVRDPAADSRPPSDREQPTVVYQLRGDPTDATLVFALDKKSRAVAADVDTRLDCEATEVRVTETIKVRVRYEPLQELFVRIPPVLASDDGQSLSVTMGDQTLSWAIVNAEHMVVPDSSGKEESPTPQDDITLPRIPTPIAQINLPQPVVGEFQITITFRVPLDTLAATKNQAFSIPVVLPDGVDVGRQTASITASDDLILVVADPVWNRQSDEVERAGPRGESQWRADRRTDRIVLSASVAEIQQVSPVHVQSLLVQSWFARDRRQDRFVYNLQTERENLRIQFPEGVSTDEILTLVDGARLDGLSETNRTLIVSLPKSAEVKDRSVARESAHVVELFYPVEESMGMTRHRIQTPIIDGVDWIQQEYWHLVLPPSKRLVSTSNALVTEDVWKWQRFWPVRTIPHDHAWLERWANSSHQAPPPASSTQYLLRSFGGRSEVQVAIVDFSWTVFLVAGTIMAIGLGILYIPLLRQPALLLVLAVLIGGLATVRPSVALNAAQAVVLGFVLCLFAASVYFLVGHRRSVGLATPTEWQPTVRRSELASSIVSRRVHEDSSPQDGSRPTVSFPGTTSSPPAPTSEGRRPW